MSKATITTTTILVTPQMAAAWLRHNRINRPVVPGVVEGFKAALLRGEWQLTHQGIAFGSDGNVYDGQHRLLAIVATGTSCLLMVTTGLPFSAFLAMDIGRKRQPSDVLHISKNLAAVARYVATLEDTGLRSAVTPAYLQQFVDIVREPHSDLVGFCPTMRKVWSSAPVQAAAVIRMLDGEDRDYVKLVYRSLVMSEFDAMPPVAQAVYRQYEKGMARRRGHERDLFARCIKVFSEPFRAQVKPMVRATDTAVVDARLVISERLNRISQPREQGITH